jgi:hypothetical protein
MKNKKIHPFVTIHSDIIEETEASSDSDATINLTTPTKQSPSLTPTADREDELNHHNCLRPTKN